MMNALTVNPSPELRRAIIQIAAQENFDFPVALEYVLLEGVKAIYQQENASKLLVGNSG